jgi:hypothetical protein
VRPVTGSVRVSPDAAEQPRGTAGSARHPRCAGPSSSKRRLPAGRGLIKQVLWAGLTAANFAVTGMVAQRLSATAVKGAFKISLFSVMRTRAALATLADGWSDLVAEARQEYEARRVAVRQPTPPAAEASGRQHT